MTHLARQIENILLPGSFSHELWNNNYYDAKFVSPILSHIVVQWPKWFNFSLEDDNFEDKMIQKLSMTKMHSLMDFGRIGFCHLPGRS